MSRRISRDVSWLWAGYSARALVYLGLVVVLTRALGPDGFGRLSLFLAVTLGVSQVAGAWPFLAVPVLSAQGRSIGAAFRPAAHVAAIATAAALLFALPVSFFVHSRASASLLALVCYSVALVGLQGIYSVFQTEGRMSSIALVQTAERGIALLLALMAVALSALSVLRAEVLLAVAAAAVCIAAYVWVNRRQSLLRRQPEDLPDHLVGTVMHAVGAMGIVSVCSYGVAWIDIYILAAFKSNSDVGIYSLAYQVFTFVAQLGSLWAFAALPVHARSVASGDSLSAQLPLRRLRVAAALWAAIIAVIAVASVVLLPHVFGSRFDDAFPPLMVLLAGSGVAVAAYFLVLPALIASGKTQLIARVSVVSVFINLVLDLILVPQIGIMGPAIATAVQTLFATAVLSGIAVGRDAALRVLTVGLPAIASVGLLAFDPGRWAFVVLASATAIATAGWAASKMRDSWP